MASRLAGTGAPENCTEDVAADLFGSDWSRRERPHTERKSFPREYQTALPKHISANIATAAAADWAVGLDEVIEVFEERDAVIRIEAEDRLWILRAAIKEIESEISQRESNPTEANQQAISNIYRPRLNQFQEEVELTQRSRDLRLKRLQESLDHLRGPTQATVALQCTAVIEIADDPVPIEEDSEDETSPTAGEFADQPISQNDASDTNEPNKPR